MKTKDDRLIRYVCAKKGKRSKKGNISHLVTAAVSDRDVIQWWKNKRK
jgi:hypothetical protein